MKTNPLVALGQAGQSPWIDYIHRGMIASGELARRIAEDGIRGVTSNPTIFEKAVASGHDYDEQIAALAKRGNAAPRRRTRDRHGRHPGGRGRAAPGVRHVEGGRRVRLARGRPGPGARHEGDDRPGAGAVRRRRPAERDDQDPRHEGRASGRGGDDRLRDSGERDADLLRETVRGRRGGVHAGPRAASRRRRRPAQGGVRGVVLRFPGRHRRGPAPAVHRRAVARLAEGGDRAVADREAGGGQRAPGVRPVRGDLLVSAVERALLCLARGCSGPCGRAPGRRTRNTPT